MTNAEVSADAAAGPAVPEPGRAPVEIGSVEIGLVSADAALAEFWAAVLGLERLAPQATQVGTLHRLRSARLTLKVMIPAAPPKPAERAASFLGVAGLRYLTVRVSDLDAVVAAAAAHGGRLVFGPMDRGADGRLAVVEDPEGNTLELVQDRA